MRLDPTIIRQQIANLFLLHPDLVEDDESWALTIESETDAVELLRSIERRRQEAASMAGAIASNIAELQLRQERFVKRERAMRDLAFRIMTETNLKRMELPEATLTIRAGTPYVIMMDSTKLPDDLVRVKREPEKQEILRRLKNGEDLNGAACLSNGHPSLSIRTK